MDIQSEIARIDRMQEETRTFCAEMRKPPPAPWQIAIIGMAAGATLFGGGMVFAKLIGV